MTLVVLVGNGLSVAVNEELRLEALTAAFLEHHEDDREDLERLVTGLHLGVIDPATDFEGLVAGLEAAEDVVSSFVGLARRTNHPDLIAAARVLEEGGVAESVRRLYYAYCAEVLDAIGDQAKGALPDGVVKFAFWLRDMFNAHGSMQLFTLNYDVLLERILVNDDLLDLRFSLTDFFSGLPERREDLQMYPDAPPVLGHAFYPEDPPDRPIELHHLHGCLTHFRRLLDGTIWKVPSADVRSLGMYAHMAHAEESPYAPAVILGSRKVQKSREWPFSFGFLSLERDARAARTVIIVGYSFRDFAVNVRLRAAAARGERRWIVIDHRPGSDQKGLYQERALEVLEPAEPQFFFEGVMGALPEVG